MRLCGAININLTRPIERCVFLILATYAAVGDAPTICGASHRIEKVFETRDASLLIIIIILRRFAATPAILSIRNHLHAFHRFHTSNVSFVICTHSHSAHTHPTCYLIESKLPKTLINARVAAVAIGRVNACATVCGDFIYSVRSEWRVEVDATLATWCI